MSEKKEDLVDVTIRLPRALHLFMGKIAELEGSTTHDWYELWIRGAFESWLNEFNGIPALDVKRLIEQNDLTTR